MAKPDPHDPGVEVARKRAKEAGEAAHSPIRAGKGEARFGTASWTDPTMTVPGVFYPPGMKTAEDRLRFYASQFSMVEVDATYYVLPNKRTAESWVERTPKYQQFREALKPLLEAGKLGAVFVQFPKWVFPSNEARELILETRQRLELPIAVEFRHGSWFNDKNAERTIKFLQDNKIPYVAVDEPQGFKSSVPPVVFPTNDDLAVFRFHGRNKESWEKKDIAPSERFRYLYDEDELADWTPKIAAIARSSKETHVVYNNCFSNYGTTNAREAARLLAEMQR